MRKSSRMAALGAAAIALLSLVSPVTVAHAAGTPHTISGVVTAPDLGLEKDIWTECMFELVPMTGSGSEYSWGACSSFVLSNVSPGQYRLHVDVSSTDAVYADTWYGGTPHEQLAPFITVGDEGATGIDIELLPAGAMTGTISLPSGGPAPRGQLMAIAHLVDPATGATTPVSESRASAGGAYRLDELPTGEYTVEYADGGNPPRYRDAFLGGVDDIAQADLVHVDAGRTVEAVDGAPMTLEHFSDRIAGNDRFATSAAIALTFDPGVPVVYLANGLNWPDALSAGPAAAFLGGPLLLTRPDMLPAPVADELERLEPDRIVVVGGLGVISDTQLRLLARYAPDIDRVAGKDRYATSRAVITDAFGDSVASKRIVVASGRTFPDSLSGGGLAAVRGAPLLLVDGLAPELGAANRAFLWGTIFESMSVVGGTGVVATHIQRELEYFTRYTASFRYGGTDRYDTNRLVMRDFPSSPHSASGYALIANGTGFADALGGVAFAGAIGAPLLLAPSNCIPAGTMEAALGVRTTDWVLLGGVGALSGRVESLISC